MTHSAKNKLLAALLLVAMLFAGLPSAVFADILPPEGEPAAAQSRQNPNYPDVIPLDMNIVQISLDRNRVMAIDDEGQLWAWGYNWLGNGDHYGRQTIMPIELPGKAVQTASGYNFTIALLEDGTVYHWGSLGDYAPVKAEGLENIVAIGAGNNNATAIDAHGNVYGWGDYNLYGQIGTGTGNRQPQLIPGLSGVDYVSSFYYTSVARQANGEYKVWGSSIENYLLAGTDGTAIQTPVSSGISDYGFKTVEVGFNTFYGLTDDGQLWAWGDMFGTAPAPVEGQSNVSQVKTMLRASAILKDDGTVWTQGNNDKGVLGRDSVVNRSEYAQVEGLEDIVNIATGVYAVYAQTSTGDWWAWGGNDTDYCVLTPGNEGYRYIFEPVLIFAADGQTTPEPETHTITVTETWADGAQPDSAATHTVTRGDTFTTSFATPAGYTAAVTSAAPIAVDTAAGTITLENVAANADITVTYTPADPGPGETHNVTVIVTYTDGAHPDEVTTYTVPAGSEFFEAYTARDDYEYYGVSLFSFFYTVNARDKTVYISEVNQDLTIEPKKRGCAFFSKILPYALLPRAGPEFIKYNA